MYFNRSFLPVVKGTKADGCSDVVGVANTGVGGCNGVEGAGNCTVCTSAGALPCFPMSLMLVVLPGVTLTGRGLSTS